MSTIFAKIIKGEIKAEKVYEDDDILAIKDIAPAAPVHLLIMPKKEIKSLQTAKKEDLPLISKVIVVAQKLAEEFGVEDGYRLLTNVGPESGQSMFPSAFSFDRRSYFRSHWLVSLPDTLPRSHSQLENVRS